VARPAALDGDPRWVWLHCHRPDHAVQVLVHQRDAAVDAMIACFVHAGRLQLGLGPLVFASRAVTRYDVRSLRDCGRAADEQPVAEALARLADSLPADGVAFLEGVAEESALARVLERRAGRRRFKAVAFGPAYRHHYIDLDGGSYDDYLARLGAKTRADLRRTRRRLEAACAGDCRVERFRAPEQVAGFIERACRISQRTWQYRDREAGLRDAQVLRERFERSARLGWFRSYLLVVEGEDAAFQVGHQAGDTYYAPEIGYDPRWAELQAGMYLNTRVIEDLSCPPDPVRVFDFGCTDSLHKQRLSTRWQLERYYYLFPARRSMRAWAAALRMSIAATDRVRALLARMDSGRKLLRRFGYDRR
jgi:hypothetical protein